MPKKILLADDARLMLEIEKSLFRRTGAEILTASTGMQALKLILSEKPDIVLLDLVMPDITGDKICEQIKSNPQTASIPVIIVTTRAKPEEIERCRLAGCDDFATKPLNHYELLTKVVQLMKIPHRRLKRVFVRLESAIEGNDSSSYGTSLDLSETGMLLETVQKLDVGEKIWVRFRFAEGVEIKVMGKVARVERAEFRNMRYGIEFIDISEEDRTRIREAIESAPPSFPSRI